MLTYVLAVLAACANATSSVLQRKANIRVPRKQNMSWRLVWSLLHEPVWFGGVLAICVGFLLQATALGSGQLSVVEPILVLELPATLILASRVFRQRMRGREWCATAAMTAGVAGMLYFLSPSAGRSTGTRWYAWLIGIGGRALRHRHGCRGPGSRPVPAVVRGLARSEAAQLRSPGCPARSRTRPGQPRVHARGRIRAAASGRRAAASRELALPKSKGAFS